MKIKITYAPAINKIVAVFPYDPDSVLAVKGIGATPVYKEKKFVRWEIDPTQENEARLLLAKDDSRFEIDSAVFFVFENEREYKQINYELSAASHADDVKINPFLDNVLKDYQKAGIEYMSRNSRGVLLADEMGLGKTLQVLAAIERMKYYPALIISPAVVKFNWLKECEKWLPHRKAALIEGYANGVKGTGPAEIYIINYDLLKKYWSLVDSEIWQALICDESHYLKNYKANRTILVKEIAKGIPHKFLLSGTPVLNRPVELISQLEILGLLPEFGGFWPFANRYCQAHKTRFGWDLTGSANLEELNKRLRENCFIRREKKEVLKELPEKRRVDLWVRIDNGPEYSKAESDLIAYLKEHARVETEYIESIKDEPREIQDRLISDYRMDKARKAARAELLVKMNVLKQITAIGKISSAVTWINDFFDSGNQKLVVFAWHTELIKKLCETFKCDSITGDTPAEERTRIVESFQTDPEIKMIVCNIQAGGVGITLTAADSSLFLEQGWNPGTMDQAEDRIHRIGQSNAVTIYYMLGEGTIDLGVWELIEEKRRVVDSTTDGFTTMRDWMIKRNRG